MQSKIMVFTSCSFVPFVASTGFTHLGVGPYYTTPSLLATDWLRGLLYSPLTRRPLGYVNQVVVSFLVMYLSSGS